MASNMWQRLLWSISILLLIQFYCVLGKSSVIRLNEDNWEEMLEKEWMVEFYAPWCPACKALQPMWDEFSSWSDDLGIKVGQVDVTSSPGLSGRFIVTALPTIFHVLNGEFRQYRGARDKDSFISFVEEKKWKSVDAIPSWKSPGSVQMSVVSYFFKLSQILRGVHNKLMEEYGVPTWGSYLIFALATIFIGALLGLVLVCLIDLIYPPKPLLLRTPAGPHEKGDDSIADETTNIKPGAGDGLDDEEDDYAKDDLVDEEGSPEMSMEEDEEEEGEYGDGSHNVRKRRARRAD